ncbi:HU family DNA-binding protein [Defluviimonas sp. SAOS-178_SWC]|uniref:HU family DNA-binding protein n=1 Tax=Defluviimonas sp. SAOS-178_SWC TaxID=3121287 RepID=UPI003221A546
MTAKKAKTASRAKAPRRAAQTPAQPTKAAPPDPVSADAEPAVQAQVLRKKDLFKRVAAATGAKAGDVRLITEAVLDILGNALSAGEALALPPFGKARVNRQKDLATGEVLIVRLRRGGQGGQAAQGGNEALEEAGE